MLQADLLMKIDGKYYKFKVDTQLIPKETLNIEMIMVEINELPVMTQYFDNPIRAYEIKEENS